jgi:hypothetical protein
MATWNMFRRANSERCHCGTSIQLPYSMCDGLRQKEDAGGDGAFMHLQQCLKLGCI